MNNSIRLDGKEILITTNINLYLSYWIINTPLQKI